jgi:hypothetical protein
MAIVIVPPGAILETLVVKMLGLFCSNNEALLPSILAVSYII